MFYTAWSPSLFSYIIMWYVASLFLTYQLHIVYCVSVLRTGCWPSNVVPYRILEGFSKDEVQHINDQISELHRLTCIRWVDVSKVPVKSKDYVRFSRMAEGDACITYKGSMPEGGAGIIIKLVDYCFTEKYVLHEMLHVLGMNHEHQRADRDCYLNIDYEQLNASGEWQNQFEIVHERWLEQFPYDKSSVMHYPRTLIMKSRTERWYSHEPLGNLSGELTFLDLWKLLYKFCHFPHYCDLFPQLCVLMDDLEKGCAK